MRKRVIMRASLQGAQDLHMPGVRPFSADDRERLGALLFDAYLGTIDQEEETIEQAHAEIDKTIAGEYGAFLPSSSMVMERLGILYSAALLTRFRSRPFLAFSFTSPRSKNQGLARACISAAMAHLRAEGEHELHLVVTLANAPAVRLYKALGFEVERDA
jgi:ribosomal protein S18 acetylase RimI-like enzyme